MSKETEFWRRTTFEAFREIAALTRRRDQCAICHKICAARFTVKDNTFRCNRCYAICRREAWLKRHAARIAVLSGEELAELQATTERFDYVLSIKLKIATCRDCDAKVTTEDSSFFEFDHLNSETKIASICSMVMNAESIATIDQEIAKCELVCKDCHDKRTRRRAAVKSVLNGILDKVCRLSEEEIKKQNLSKSLDNFLPPPLP